jgi:hypothetical protein
MSIKTVRSPRLAATVQTIKPRCTGTLNKGNIGPGFRGRNRAALSIQGGRNLQASATGVNIS